MPLLLASLPTAFVGGFIILDEHIYKTVTESSFRSPRRCLLGVELAMEKLIDQPRYGAPRNWKWVTWENRQTG